MTNLHQLTSHIDIMPYNMEIISWPKIILWRHFTPCMPMVGLIVRCCWTRSMPVFRMTECYLVYRLRDRVSCLRAFSVSRNSSNEGAWLIKEMRICSTWSHQQYRSPKAVLRRYSATIVGFYILRQKSTEACVLINTNCPWRLSYSHRSRGSGHGAFQNTLPCASCIDLRLKRNNILFCRGVDIHNR